MALQDEDRRTPRRPGPPPAYVPSRRPALPPVPLPPAPVIPQRVTPRAPGNADALNAEYRRQQEARARAAAEQRRQEAEARAAAQTEANRRAALEEKRRQDALAARTRAEQQAATAAKRSGANAPVAAAESARKRRDAAANTYYAGHRSNIRQGDVAGEGDYAPQITAYREAQARQRAEQQKQLALAQQRQRDVAVDAFTTRTSNDEAYRRDSYTKETERNAAREREQEQGYWDVDRIGLDAQGRPQQTVPQITAANPALHGSTQRDWTDRAPDIASVPGRLGRAALNTPVLPGSNIRMGQVLPAVVQGGLAAVNVTNAAGEAVRRTGDSQMNQFTPGVSQHFPSLDYRTARAGDALTNASNWLMGNPDRQDTAGRVRAGFQAGVTKDEMTPAAWAEARDYAHTRLGALDQMGVETLTDPATLLGGLGLNRAARLADPIGEAIAPVIQRAGTAAAPVVAGVRNTLRVGGENAGAYLGQAVQGFGENVLGAPPLTSVAAGKGIPLRPRADAEAAAAREAAALSAADPAARPVPAAAAPPAMSAAPATYGAPDLASNTVLPYGIGDPAKFKGKPYVIQNIDRNANTVSLLKAKAGKNAKPIDVDRDDPLLELPQAPEIKEAAEPYTTDAPAVDAPTQAAPDAAPALDYDYPIGPVEGRRSVFPPMGSMDNSIPTDGWTPKERDLADQVEAYAENVNMIWREALGQGDRQEWQRIATIKEAMDEQLITPEEANRLVMRNGTVDAETLAILDSVAPRATPPATAPSGTQAPDGMTPYGRDALYGSPGNAGNLDQLASAGAGNRYNGVQTPIFKTYQLVAGGEIDEAVADRLIWDVLDSLPTDKNFTPKTKQKFFDTQKAKGMAKPRYGKPADTSAPSKPVNMAAVPAEADPAPPVALTGNDAFDVVDDPTLPKRGRPATAAPDPAPAIDPLQPSGVAPSAELPQMPPPLVSSGAPQTAGRNAAIANAGNGTNVPAPDAAPTISGANPDSLLKPDRTPAIHAFLLKEGMDNVDAHQVADFAANYRVLAEIDMGGGGTELRPMFSLDAERIIQAYLQQNPGDFKGLHQALQAMPDPNKLNDYTAIVTGEPAAAIPTSIREERTYREGMTAQQQAESQKFAIELEQARRQDRNNRDEIQRILNDVRDAQRRNDAVQLQTAQQDFQILMARQSGNDADARQAVQQQFQVDLTKATWLRDDTKVDAQRLWDSMQADARFDDQVTLQGLNQRFQELQSKLNRDFQQLSQKEQQRFQQGERQLNQSFQQVQQYVQQAHAEALQARALGQSASQFTAGQTQSATQHAASITQSASQHAASITQGATQHAASITQSASQHAASLAQSTSQFTQAQMTTHLNNAQRSLETALQNVGIPQQNIPRIIARLNDPILSDAVRLAGMEDAARAMGSRTGRQSVVRDSGLSVFWNTGIGGGIRNRPGGAAAALIGAPIAFTFALINIYQRAIGYEQNERMIKSTQGNVQYDPSHIVDFIMDPFIKWKEDTVGLNGRETITAQQIMRATKEKDLFGNPNPDAMMARLAAWIAYEQNGTPFPAGMEDIQGIIDGTNLGPPTTPAPTATTSASQVPAATATPGATLTPSSTTSTTGDPAVLDEYDRLYDSVFDLEGDDRKAVEQKIAELVVANQGMFQKAGMKAHFSKSGSGRVKQILQWATDYLAANPSASTSIDPSEETAAVSPVSATPLPPVQDASTTPSGPLQWEDMTPDQKATVKYVDDLASSEGIFGLETGDVVVDGGVQYPAWDYYEYTLASEIVQHPDLFQNSTAGATWAKTTSGATLPVWEWAVGYMQGIDPNWTPGAATTTTQPTGNGAAKTSPQVLAGRAEPATGAVTDIVPGGKVISTWGQDRSFLRGEGAVHEGIDIGAPNGTPIYARAGGTVTFVGIDGDPNNPAPAGGNFVQVLDENGYSHYYAHMINEPTYRVGDFVRAGQTLGGIGTSGDAKGSEPHLHYQYGLGENWQDPLPTFQAQGNGGGKVNPQVMRGVDGPPGTEPPPPPGPGTSTIPARPGGTAVGGTGTVLPARPGGTPVAATPAASLPAAGPDDAPPIPGRPLPQTTAGGGKAAPSNPQVAQGAALRNAYFDSGFASGPESAMRAWAIANPDAARLLEATWMGVENGPSMYEWATTSTPVYGADAGGGRTTTTPAKPLPSAPGVAQGAALRNAYFDSGFAGSAESAMRAWAIANPDAARQLEATWLGVENGPSMYEWATVSVPQFDPDAAPPIGPDAAPKLPSNPQAATGLALMNRIFTSNFADASFNALYAWALSNPDAAAQIPATWTAMGDAAPSVLDMARAQGGMGPMPASTAGYAGSSGSSSAGYSGGGSGYSGGGGGGFSSRAPREPRAKEGDSRNQGGKWEVYRAGQWIPQVDKLSDILPDDRNLIGFAIQTGATSVLEAISRKYGLSAAQLRLMFQGAGEFRMYPSAPTRVTY